MIANGLQPVNLYSAIVGQGIATPLTALGGWEQNRSAARARFDGITLTFATRDPIDELLRDWQALGLRVESGSYLSPNDDPSVAAAMGHLEAGAEATIEAIDASDDKDVEKARAAVERAREAFGRATEALDAVDGRPAVDARSLHREPPALELDARPIADVPPAAKATAVATLTLSASMLAWMALALAL